MKRIIIFFTMTLLLSFGVNAQTMSTDYFNTSEGNMPVIGNSFDVPIDVLSIGTIFTFTVYFEFDPAVLTWDGTYSEGSIANISVTLHESGVLKIIGSGAFPDGVIVPDSPPSFLKLQFTYLGGYSELLFWTTDYGTTPSRIARPDFTVVNFSDDDVTNGAVQVEYDDVIDGGYWNIASNWLSGRVANEYANVTVAAGTETTIDAAAACNDITIEQGGMLTQDVELTVGGDFLIESDASGSGSYINNVGPVKSRGTSSVECYVTNGQWHGIAAPVEGEDFNSMYLGNPIVWIKEYAEATNTYELIQDVNTPMGDMKGWMTWIETASTPQTFTFEGDFRTGTVGADDNMVRTALGHNFVGNPFTSAIDWEATSGWTKTGLYDAIYVYNDDNWATYIDGEEVNDGTQYIAMNQGFFVQVASVGTGTLKMDERVCVHNDVDFLKEQLAEQQTIRLEVEANGLVDEAVVRFKEDATVAFDGNMDASKFFSLNESYPQLYSTANNYMSINSLPFEIMEESVAMDVVGEDGNSMTITATESADFDELYLRDEYTGITTDLKTSDYTFTYNSSVTNRFSLFFNTTGIDDESISNSNFSIFAYDKNIQVQLDGLSNVNITVYNLMGQKINTVSTNSTTIIPVNKTGYYFVKVSDGVSVSTQKVFIK